MKNWNKPEINSVTLNSTEVLKTVKINVGDLEFGNPKDIYVVMSEGSPDDPIAVSYTHLRAPRDRTRSRMPSSA